MTRCTRSNRCSAPVGWSTGSCQPWLLSSCGKFPTESPVVKRVFSLAQTFPQIHPVNGCSAILPESQLAPPQPTTNARHENRLLQHHDTFHQSDAEISRRFAGFHNCFTVATGR